MKNIVNYNWLRENMNKENLIILDTREDLRAYEEGHIKGAQYVSIEEVAIGEKSIHGGRSPLPDLQVFIEDMKNLGIDDASIVLIYDDGNLSLAGRLWWLLKYIGKKDVFILEGGIEKWQANGGEITREIPKINKSNKLSLNINEDIKVDMTYVRNSLNAKDIAIVDARAHERYTGQVEPLDKKAGHIPGALNYPWTNLVKEGNIVAIDELKEYFKALENYDEVIVYCGSGITATVDILLMEEAGIKAKMYPGSFSDWISYDENQVETGNSSQDK